jgi:hypothetical protein
VAEIHPWVGAAVIAVCACAAFLGGLRYWRGRGAGTITTHLLSLAQTLLVAQVAIGLLLLADDRRAADDLHYAYGAMALGVALVPWFYAPERRRRPRDPRLHDGRRMRRLWENRFLRGMAVIAVVSLGIVVLSLENALLTAGALMRIAFVLGIAFFLFLLWRERRSEIETWSDLSRRTFYGAIVLAVLTIGAALGLGPTGADTIVFFVVLGCCAWAIFRVWRREHRYV